MPIKFREVLDWVDSLPDGDPKDEVQYLKTALGHFRDHCDTYIKSAETPQEQLSTRRAILRSILRHGEQEMQQALNAQGTAEVGHGLVNIFLDSLECLGRTLALATLLYRESDVRKPLEYYFWPGYEGLVTNAETQALSTHRVLLNNKIGNSEEVESCGYGMRFDLAPSEPPIVYSHCTSSIYYAKVLDLRAENKHARKEWEPGSTHQWMQRSPQTLTEKHCPHPLDVLCVYMDSVDRPFQGQPGFLSIPLLADKPEDWGASVATEINSSARLQLGDNAVWPFNDDQDKLRECGEFDEAQAWRQQQYTQWVAACFLRKSDLTALEGQLGMKAPRLPRMDNPSGEHVFSYWYSLSLAPTVVPIHRASGFKADSSVQYLGTCMLLLNYRVDTDFLHIVRPWLDIVLRNFRIRDAGYSISHASNILKKAKGELSEVEHLYGIEPEVSHLIRGIDTIRRRAVRLERRISPSASGLLAQDEDLVQFFQGGATLTVSLWVGQSAFDQIQTELIDLGLPKCRVTSEMDYVPEDVDLVQGNRSASETLKNARYLLSLYAPFAEALETAVKTKADKANMGKGILSWSPGYEISVQQGARGGPEPLPLFHDPGRLSEGVELELWLNNHIPIMYILGLSRANRLLMQVASYCHVNGEMLREEHKSYRATSIFNFLKLLFHRLHHPGRNGDNKVYLAQLLAVLHLAAWKSSSPNYDSERQISSVSVSGPGGEPSVDIGNLQDLLPLLWDRKLVHPTAAKNSPCWLISGRSVDFLTALEQLLMVELRNKDEGSKLSKISVELVEGEVTIRLVCKIRDLSKKRFDIRNLPPLVDGSAESRHGMTRCINVLSDSLNRGHGQLRIDNIDEIPEDKMLPSRHEDVWILRLTSESVGVDQW